MKSFVAYGLVLFATFAYVAADRKRCFCKVVLADDKRFVADMGDNGDGVVKAHRHWLSVGFKNLISCPDTCDQRVKEWVCKRQSECNNLTGGKKVVPSWKASMCKEGYVNNARTCGCDFEKCMLECGTRTPVIELIKCMFSCHHQ